MSDGLLYAPAMDLLRDEQSCTWWEQALRIQGCDGLSESITARSECYVLAASGVGDRHRSIVRGSLGSTERIFEVGTLDKVSIWCGLILLDRISMNNGHIWEALPCGEGWRSRVLSSSFYKASIK